MNDFVTALGLVLVIEGILYAVLPGGMKTIMRGALETSNQTLRITGLAIAAMGLIIVWIIRG